MTDVFVGITDVMWAIGWFTLATFYVGISIDPLFQAIIGKDYLPAWADKTEIVISVASGIVITWAVFQSPVAKTIFGGIVLLHVLFPLVLGIKEKVEGRI